TDSGGNLFVSGYYYSSVQFGYTNLSSLGLEDVFIAKIPAFTPIAPMITLSPQSQTVRTGSNVVFSVTANGTQPFHYQWQFQGTNVPAEGNASITISNVQPNNQGSYRVLVGNASGTVTSM